MGGQTRRLNMEQLSFLKQQVKMVQDPTDVIAFHFSMILKELGYNTSDPGLVDTPQRVARYLQEFLVNYNPGNYETVFESVTVDQMVVVKDMPFWSLCEHHALPWRGLASVGYLTGSQVLGLSKIPRIMQKYAHRLQLQERMAHQIADELEKVLYDSGGIAVFIKGEHSCMSMRGIRSEGTMITSVMRGAFMDDKSVRDEFLSLVK